MSLCGVCTCHISSRTGPRQRRRRITQCTGRDDIVPPNRHARERRNPHPVYGAFMQHEESINFSRAKVRDAVIPAYMGLIKQIDDHLGRLWRFLEERGLMERTLIVFTSDHGDYLGDHWLGEKDLFHEESVRVPMILYDPDARANRTRNTVDDRLVEAIDFGTDLRRSGGRRRAGRPYSGGTFIVGCDAGTRTTKRTCLGAPPRSASAIIPSVGRGINSCDQSTVRAAGCSVPSDGNTSSSNHSARNYSICARIRTSLSISGETVLMPRYAPRCMAAAFAAWLRARIEPGHAANHVH